LYGSYTSLLTTKDLLTSVKHAHAEYVLELDEEEKDKQLNEEAIKKHLYENEELKALQKKQEHAFMLLYEQEALEKERCQEQDMAG